MGKTSISVPEMQSLLGMKKVEAYWPCKTETLQSYSCRRQNADHAGQL